jgi:molybdopterin converting factor small subunit
MPLVRFTQNIQRHVPCPTREVAGQTVGAVLDAYFELVPRARGYVLDDQGAVRPHMMIFLNGAQLGRTDQLAAPVASDDSIDVMQALSGG